MSFAGKFQKKVNWQASSKGFCSCLGNAYFERDGDSFYSIASPELAPGRLIYNVILPGCLMIPYAIATEILYCFCCNRQWVHKDCNLKSCGFHSNWDFQASSMNETYRKKENQAGRRLHKKPANISKQENENSK